MHDRILPGIAAIAVVLTACSGATTEPSAATNPIESTGPVEPISSPSEAGDTPSPTSPADTESAPPADLDTDSTTGPITVSSSAIPAELANALRGNGGELADTEDWTERFNPVGIPTLDGPGVSLVEATLTATRTPGGWDRVDALQWLFTSTTPRDELLDQIAFDAGIAGQEPDVETSTVDAADCVVRNYLASDSSTSWQVQGCAFEQFPNMVSIGVTRTATVTADYGPTGLDPSIASAVENIDGEIADVEIAFGAPAAGSTSTLRVAVEITSTVTDPAGALANGALSTWQRSDGEAGLVSFSGSPGSHWNVTASSIRFSHEGRLAP